MISASFVRYGLPLYILALFASWFTMENRTQELPEKSPDWREIHVPASSDDLSTTAPLRYRIIPAAGRPAEALPVLFLHGSPMASYSFNPLLKALPEKRTYIVPDLPGFGESLYGFTDFSFAAHTEAISRLLEAEGLTRIHVVAYSQGGGPALLFSERSPEKVASLTLLSSIGVQEHELTGDYFLNHVLHGMQLLGLETLRWGVPHFGRLDDFLINTRYARNFYYSDMRPLRTILRQIEAPTFIIHGRDDALVPVSAATEHERIIPHSELQLIDGGHMQLMRDPNAVAALLGEFFQRVESGDALHRIEATEERIQRAQPVYSGTPRTMGPLFLGLTLFTLAASTLVSEDLSCIVAGLLASRDIIPLPHAIAACFLGIWIGDMLLYAVGRFGGRWLIERRPLSWFISIESLTPASQWLEKRGAVTIFASRFLPGTRLPLYLASGVLKVPAAKIMLWLALAGIFWTIPVISLIAYFGQHVIDWLEVLGKTAFPGAVIFILCIWFAMKQLPRLMTEEGRRLAAIKFVRIRRWEFWPRAAFYGPLFPLLGAIALKRRSLLGFTACNPGIPQSGIVGESKWDILQNLKTSGTVPPCILVTENMDDPSKSVFEWMQTYQLEFPIVVKPDQGERGDGVKIIRSQIKLEAALKETSGPLIVQDYIEGFEFGILYIRPPAAAKGFIFSLTRKIMTSVEGDGSTSLRNLILRDPRASLSHVHFFKIHADRLQDIPQAGERIELASLGSHCRGSLFETGMDLITPELEKEIDRIAHCFNGFHLGRFDIRCPSEDALKKGKDLKIIELNGVTSEPTHIYHPHTPLRTGYMTIVQQWRWAYDIGLANAKNGAHISTWREVFHLLTTNRSS